MGNIFANSVSDMELIFRIINNSYNSTKIKKKKNLEEWAKNLNRHLSKEDIQMADKHMKR